MSQAFELPEEMTIYSAVETRDALLAWVTAQTAASSKVLEISAAKVSEIDGSGLQLLVSLSHIDQPWKLTQPTDALVQACATLGLGDWLAEQTAA
ncbi:STAS domain-containing protein [Rhodoferax sp.]|uniref:STAS domain-containing protein n=1 Tax=Rhodoferax sp. TaxID=50421 RepID=UPI00261F42C2|nr:STAS domain-containing protein [Rhodoferax sp.]MDD2808386.1 STAS domain-containing protein [Rhodoferax sp.]MDD4942984.1 STAS domain-containing protein [Rhodoferax sp.]